MLKRQRPGFLQAVGGVQKKRAGKTLEGRVWDEMPARLDAARA
jgi:protein gp37